MDENNYRDTYREINDLPCVYEKAILQRCCGCSLARHFNLAERIGVACTSNNAQNRCKKFLSILQQKSVFALQTPEQAQGELPHAKKIKIQCGGAIGLKSLENVQAGELDINTLLDRACELYGDIESLPYEELVRSVVHFEGRKRRKQK